MESRFVMDPRHSSTAAQSVVPSGPGYPRPGRRPAHPGAVSQRFGGGPHAEEDGTLLRLDDLTVGYFETGNREPVKIVRNVDLAIKRHEILGLVGESGSGKTQTARAILKINTRPLQPVAGHIYLDDVDLLTLEGDALREVRGGKISMIFQDPRASLNPLMRIGDQLARIYALHKRISDRAAHAEALSMLRRVGIAGPERVARSYPHQLSGGMCQRVMIGLCVGINPALLIADEPTTGLDVTIQAQILELIQEMQAQTGASVLLITHDLGVVAEVCQRVAVMYAGRVVEIARVGDIFSQPLHPYTIRLLRASLALENPVGPVPPWPAESAADAEKDASSSELTVGQEWYEVSLESAEAAGHGGAGPTGAVLVEVGPEHLVLAAPVGRDGDASSKPETGPAGLAETPVDRTDS